MPVFGARIKKILNIVKMKNINAKNLDFTKSNLKKIIGKKIKRKIKFISLVIGRPVNVLEKFDGVKKLKKSNNKFNFNIFLSINIFII
tara:strand:+ start:193 stop:456 length:264 start_codon:yes stop_codon:yes gene_type:complete